MDSLYVAVETACHDLFHLSTLFPIVVDCITPTRFLIHHWYHHDMFLRLDIQCERPREYFNSPLSYRVLLFQKRQEGVCKCSTLCSNIPVRHLSIVLAELISDYLLPYSLRLKDGLVSRYKRHMTTVYPLSLLSFYHLCTHDIFVWNQYTVPQTHIFASF